MLVVGPARALALVAALAGCAAVGGGGSAADGLSGTAVVVQDVEGLGEQPLEGWLVAVPAASADGVWPAGALPSEGELPYASAPLSRTQVEDAGGGTAAIDDGEFSLDAPAGRHLLCLVQDSGSGEHARGCGYAHLPSSGRIEVTTGEAGFRVEVASS